MVVATDGDESLRQRGESRAVKKPLMVLATLPRVLAPGEPPICP
jgi:uncharacterized protein YfaS (alpha-2-macroglobulin family)